MVESAQRSDTVFYGYWLVAIAFVAQFVALGVYSYVSGPFFIPMTDELNWSRADFTLARTLGQVVMAITGFIVGGYVDRIGGKRLMLIGTSVLSVSLCLHAYIETLWAWILLNGVAVTIGCALLGNLVVNVTLAKWFVEKRGRAVAWAAMGVSFAGIVLTPVVTYWIDHDGWRASWVYLGIGVAVIMYPVAILVRRAPEDHGLHPDGKSDADVAAGLAATAAEDFARSLSRGQALRTFSFYALVVAFGLFSINIVVMLLQTVPYLTDEGLSRNEAAVAIVVASVPAMFSKPVWGYFIDRLRPKPLAALGAAVTGLALFVIVWSVQRHNTQLIYVGYFALGLGWGGMIPLQEVIWGAYFGRRYLGAVRSAGLPITLLFGALAPLLVSLYHDAYGNYHGALLVVAGLNVCSGLLLLMVQPPKAAIAVN